MVIENPGQWFYRTVQHDHLYHGDNLRITFLQKCNSASFEVIASRNIPIGSEKAFGKQSWALRGTDQMITLVVPEHYRRNGSGKWYLKMVLEILGKDVV